MRPESILRRSFAILSVSLLVGFGSSASAQKRLSGTEQRRVAKELAALRGAGEVEARKILLRLASYGPALRGHLNALGTKDPSRGEVFQALQGLDEVEGRDLMLKEVKARKTPWSLGSPPVR